MMAMGNDEVMITKRVTLYEATSFFTILVSRCIRAHMGIRRLVG
jgi:hypothetical protein